MNTFQIKIKNPRLKSISSQDLIQKKIKEKEKCKRETLYDFRTTKKFTRNNVVKS